MAQANKHAVARARKPLTQDRLKAFLLYDPVTGFFTWKVNILCGKGRAIVSAGDIAGCIVNRAHTQYIEITIDGKHFYAHRLAFLYMTGEMPKLADHEDCDGLNNRWNNLRSATKSQNAANSRTARNNRARFKGVMRDKHRKKWVAQIKPNRKSTHLGTFDTVEEAQAAYATAARAIYGDFARIK